MFPAHDITSIVIVHETMVREEMERNRPWDSEQRSGHAHRSGVVTSMRTIVAQALCAAGAWVAPAPKPGS